MSSRMNMIKSGKLLGNGAARKVVLGYKPKKVELINITDRISYEKMELMDAKSALKRVAAGTGTYVDAITIDSDGFTIEAAEYVSAKEYHYAAYQAENES